MAGRSAIRPWRETNNGLTGLLPGFEVRPFEGYVVGFLGDLETAARETLFKQGCVRHVAVHAAHREARLDECRPRPFAIRS